MRIVSHGRTESFDRLRHFPFTYQIVAKISVALDRLGIQANRLIYVVQCFLLFAQLQMTPAQIRLGISIRLYVGELRPKSGRLFELVPCRVKLRPFENLRRGVRTVFGGRNSLIRLGNSLIRLGNSLIRLGSSRLICSR